MDEVLQFCRRVLGSPTLAQAAATQAKANGSGDRLPRLAHASRACRERVNAVETKLDAGSPVIPGTATAEPLGLTATVARELEVANARLPERHREVLVLRELLGLSHDQIAAVTGLEATAVGPSLARARLQLRAELRGPLPRSADPCASQDRAIRLLARRQDAESVSGQDESWLLDHLGTCEPCARLHAAMLEASACYGGWRAEEPVPSAR